MGVVDFWDRPFKPKVSAFEPLHLALHQDRAAEELGRWPGDRSVQARSPRPAEEQLIQIP